MTATDRRKRLFDDLVRLRRIERALPDNRDLAAIRATLEEELGETVSRRFAARALGVTHPALARWIEAGDLPIVYGVNGRYEVPVPALLDLHAAVERERESGRRRRHVLEPVMNEGRERARTIRAEDLVRGASRDSHGHNRVDRRNLAYHRAVAKDLRRPLIDEARHRVWKWRDQGKLDPRYADQWEEVLRKPVKEVRRAITADTPFARDLRQNSPFAGALSEPERRKIIGEIH